MLYVRLLITLTLLVSICETHSWLMMSASEKFSPHLQYLPARGTTTSVAFYASHGSSTTPGVIFCCGFRSSMTGQKAIAIENFCNKNDLFYVRFDYRGHGESSSNFTEFTIESWIEDTLDILDHVAPPGKHLFVGSSMGCWIALQVALKRPHRVASILGIASAPDFTEDIWNGFSSQDKAKLKEKGVVFRPSRYDDEPYPITSNLIEDGKKYLVLQNSKLSSIDFPVRLLHGLEDSDIPWMRSIDLAQAIGSKDVSVVLIKEGDHRLSRKEDLDKIIALVQELVNCRSINK